MDLQMLRRQVELALDATDEEQEIRVRNFLRLMQCEWDDKGLDPIFLKVDTPVTVCGLKHYLEEESLSAAKEYLYMVEQFLYVMTKKEMPGTWELSLMIGQARPVQIGTYDTFEEAFGEMSDTYASELSLAGVKEGKLTYLNAIIHTTDSREWKLTFHLDTSRLEEYRLRKENELMYAFISSVMKHYDYAMLSCEEKQMLAKIYAKRTI